MPEIAASPEAIRAATAAWQRARFLDDKLGEPDPGRIAAWAEIIQKWQLSAADAVAGVDRYYEGETAGRIIQIGNLLHHAREVRHQRAEREKAAEVHAAAALNPGEGWAGLPLKSSGRPIRTAYAVDGAVDRTCPNCDAQIGAPCTSATGEPQKVPCLSRIKGRLIGNKRKPPKPQRRAA